MGKRDPNVEAYKVLRRFVLELRRFVRNQLAALHGEAWVEEGVPPKIAETCRDFERQWRARPWVATESESLLDFSYEDDLKTIIVWDDNWKRIFRQFFGSDKKQLEMRLEYVNWIRDHIAHFRPVGRGDLQQLRSFCKGIWDCINRAGAIQADSSAPEGLLPPDDLLAAKQPADLIAAARRAGASRRAKEPSAMEGAHDEEIARGIQQFLLGNEFELGAIPDESDVQPIRVHQFFDEWNEAPEGEVLMWQSYAPREPVARRSKVHLAIRYNPVAQNVTGAKGKQGVGWWSRRTKCAVRDPTTEQWKIFGDIKLEPKGWASVEYVPGHKGRYHITWGARPSGRAWVRDEFDVR